MFKIVRKKKPGIFSSKPRKLYKKFVRVKPPKGRNKINKIVRSLKQDSNLNADNFFQALEKIRRVEFPDLKQGEVDVVDFYILNNFVKNLQTVGEDAQLANIDLQNALQKQQQTLQLISIVSSIVLHINSLFYLVIAFISIILQKTFFIVYNSIFNYS